MAVSDGLSFWVSNHWDLENPCSLIRYWRSRIPSCPTPEHYRSLFANETLTPVPPNPQITLLFSCLDGKSNSNSHTSFNFTSHSILYSFIPGKTPNLLRTILVNAVSTKPMIPNLRLCASEALRSKFGLLILRQGPLRSYRCMLPIGYQNSNRPLIMAFPSSLFGAKL